LHRTKLGPDGFGRGYAFEKLYADWFFHCRVYAKFGESCSRASDARAKGANQLLACKQSARGAFATCVLLSKINNMSAKLNSDQGGFETEDNF
jgi:hypothetical protein